MDSRPVRGMKVGLCIQIIKEEVPQTTRKSVWNKIVWLTSPSLPLSLAQVIIRNITQPAFTCLL